MDKPVLQKFLFGAAAVAVLLLSCAGYCWQLLNRPLSLDGTVLFEVRSGASLAQVSTKLGELGYMDSPILFEGWARISGSAGKIKAGEYELSDSITPRLLLEKLVAGDIKQYQVTLVEGWTFQQALEAIWNSPGIRPSLRSSSTEEITSAFTHNFSSPEGLLFPDTYFYSGSTADTEILVRAHERLLMILDQQWNERLGALPYESSYEALIMASVVEKESSEASERGDIAGVFIRRLESNMRLQSDPTVIYGLAESYNGDLTRKDLEQVTPYNTYRINGLPPTPIALAGRESIEASLNPYPSDYLYFVAKGDGSHYFSSTLEEHNAAVRRYQLGLTN